MPLRQDRKARETQGAAHLTECVKCQSPPTEFMEGVGFEDSKYACSRYRCHDCKHNFGIIHNSDDFPPAVGY